MHMLYLINNYLYDMGLFQMSIHMNYVQDYQLEFVHLPLF